MIVEVKGCKNCPFCHYNGDECMIDASCFLTWETDEWYKDNLYGQILDVEKTPDWCPLDKIDKVYVRRII